MFINMSGLTTRNLFKSDSLNDVLDKYQLSPKRFLKVDKFYKVLKCSFKFKTIKMKNIFLRKFINFFYTKLLNSR